jgi:hypothetical protein
VSDGDEAYERPQVSWKVIEAHAKVVAADGREAARVSRVVGDPDADVFTGLAVKPDPLASERILPSERVTAIWPDRIETDLAPGEARRLPEYEDAPTVRVRAGDGGWFWRLFRRG